MSKIVHSTLEKIASGEKKAIISGPFGSNISSKYFVESGIPVIRGNNLSLGLEKFFDEGFVFITKEKADELSCDAFENDLIFTAAGTIGQVGIIPPEAKFKRYVISNKQIRARLNDDMIDIDYAYYWFSSPWIRKILMNSNKGSTVPLLTLSEVKQLPISYPLDKTVQKKISGLLNAIYKKIELNNKIISELESMAKTLYDYWFLQFDFPDENGKPYKSSGGKMVYNEELKREIPEGWAVKEITNFCDIVDCLHSKKPNYKYENEECFLLTLENLETGKPVNVSEKYYVSQDDYNEWSSRIEVKHNDFVITNAGRAGDVFRIPKDVKCAIGRNLTAVRPVEINSEYLNGFFKSIYFEEQLLGNLDCGSFFKSFNVKSIKTIKVLLPEKIF